MVKLARLNVILSCNSSGAQLLHPQKTGKYLLVSGLNLQLAGCAKNGSGDDSAKLAAPYKVAGGRVASPIVFLVHQNWNRP